MKANDFAKLFGCVLLCELAGIVGSLLMGDSVNTWYALLVKPSWTPPSWGFAPVWVTLYALMGASLYLVLRGRGSKEDQLFFFSLQLGVNVMWSFVFFGLREVVGAFVGILVLLVLIVLTMVSFWDRSRVAVGLLVPYLVWVSVASLLNFQILLLNGYV